MTDATRLWGSVLGRKSDTVVDWAAPSAMVRASPRAACKNIFAGVYSGQIVMGCNSTVSADPIDADHHSCNNSFPRFQEKLA